MLDLMVSTVVSRTPPKIRPPPIFAARLQRVNIFLASTPPNKPNNVAARTMMKSVVYVWAYYTLYCVCVITSRRTRVAAAEEDAVGEQQAEADAVGEQQLKRIQSWRSWVHSPSLSSHLSSSPMGVFSRDYTV